MKKYPVTYKGKEYEVRWEGYSSLIELVIYEVKTINIFGKLKIKTYKEKFKEYESVIKKIVSILSSNPTYYIEEVKELFKLWEADEYTKKYQEEIKNKKYQALAEWDGVIDE